MATFYANPDEKHELWIEKAALGSRFRIWHYIFFCFSAFTILAVLICCCVKIRVPRTKQEIEADYLRKKLAEKFRERLKLIQNQDMDALDLEKALEIIQEDYRSEHQNCQFPPNAPSAFILNNENEAQPLQTFQNVANIKKFAKLSSKKRKF